MKEKGQLDEAIAAYHQAITDKPNYAEAHNNLGNALKNKGQLDEAIAAYHRAIAIKPNYAEAHSNLGNALKDNGQFDEAIAACRQAIALKPNLPEAHYNLANALKDREQFDESIAAYQQAIAIKPNYPEAYSNLGAALKDKGQLDKAIVACRQAIVLKPNLLEAHYNLGNALKNKGQLEEAIASIRQAIIIKPNYAEAHCALALTLLLQAEFVQGWEEYEWRWKLKGFSSLLGKCMQAIWEGNHLRGHTILLHAEQGFGDTLQLIRYLPLVQERCAKIIVECQPELQRLLQAMLVDHTVVARGQPLPSFDIHCPLLSLPRLFTTDLTNIPSNVPYLHANATNARVWRDRLADHSSSAKVGIVWAGNPANTNDRNRTLKLLTLAPLAGVSNVRFFSLQKGMAGSEAKTLPIGMQLTDFADELKDFADTAALIANLDLVITVDTAVAHLAGAMGRPVWTLLPFAPDWRWLLDREDSPWYPTMRLFRQPALGDWDSVIRRLAGELAALQN